MLSLNLCGQCEPYLQKTVDLAHFRLHLVHVHRHLFEDGSSRISLHVVNLLVPPQSSLRIEPWHCCKVSDHVSLWLDEYVHFLALRQVRALHQSPEEGVEERAPLLQKV